MPGQIRTKYNTPIGDSLTTDPNDALATFLGLDSATGPVDLDHPMGDPSLELADLRHGRETELKQRALMGTDPQAKGLLGLLQGEIAADPYTGVAARKKAQADRDAYTAAVVTNEPSNPLAQDRMRQEQFILAKEQAGHPNFNQNLMGGMSIAGADGSVPLRNPKLQAKFDEVTADLPAEAKATIRGIIQRDATIPTSGTAYTKMLPFLQRAQLIDPSLDLKKYQTQQQYMNDYAKGGVYKQRTALDTVMHHMDEFARSAEGLHNSGGSPLSKATNYLGNMLRANTSGFPALRSFEGAADAVTGELSNVFKASGATDQEIRTWRNNLSSSATPEEFQATIGELVRLINGRMEAVQKGYRDTMGEEPEDFLSPESRTIYDKYKSSGRVQVPAGAVRRIE